MKLKQLTETVGVVFGKVPQPFPRDIKDFPPATSPEIIELNGGDTFNLNATIVQKRIGEASVKMFGYNGSIPGPTLKVRQDSEVTIHFTNQLDLETTVHWHGLRLDHRFDGVPAGEHHGMQPPLKPGDSFSYRLRFPDPGVYWYHPHMREDYTQELGLYGTIIVTPKDSSYWGSVNNDYALMLDDILIERGKIAPFSQTTSNRTAMGRYGNVMLVNGETNYSLQVKRGETVRFYLTNVANVRPFNIRIPDAHMKLAGGDNGRLEHEEFVDEVLIAPSERAVVDVYFPQAGQVVLEHRTPGKSYPLVTIEVSEETINKSFAQDFLTLRRSAELESERKNVVKDFERETDKTLTLVGEMPGMKHGAHHMESIEWEDTMKLHNRLTTPKNMHWKIVDQDGNANHDIHWTFNQGERVKVRIINTPHSDHPMQHPIHFHGQRFLILSRDGIRNDNLAWKDTVLLRTGETVDILVDMSNPGTWMTHCHIAEHLESHMMFTFAVLEQEGGHHHQASMPSAANQSE